MLPRQPQTHQTVPIKSNERDATKALSALKLAPGCAEVGRSCQRARRSGCWLTFAPGWPAASGKVRPLDGLKAASDDMPHSDATLLTIAIPLPPVEDAGQWGQVGRILSATLRSIYAQSDAAFRIMVCGDRMPAIDIVPDFRLEYVETRS